MAAKAAAAKKAHEEAEFQRKFNPHDGLLHDDDGERYFADGTQVRGVNKFVKMKNKSKKVKHHARKHRDDVEDQQKGEMASAKKDAQDKENAAKLAFEESERKRKWNQFDGSNHLDDGSRILPDGTTVSGVNYDLKLKNRHHKHHSNVHAQTHVRRDDEDSLREAEDRANELNAAN